MRTLLPLAAGLLIGATATAARADDTAKAKVYFDAGAAAYEAGNFAAAAQAFTAAYATSPRPQILFSLAQAERREWTANHKTEFLADAIKHFREYLAEVKQGGRRTDAVEALAELDAAAGRLGPGGLTGEAARPQKTRIMVTPSPKDATILLDGQAQDGTPLIAEVKPGPHKLKIVAKGYVDDEREVTSVEGTFVAVEVALRERPARLVLNATDGTEVAVDGRPYGVAPLAAIELPSGPHTVVFTRTGRRPVLRALTLERGESTTVAVALDATTQRRAAFVLLGVGAASAVGGAVLTGLAMGKQGQATDIKGQAAQHTITQAQADTYNAAIQARDGLRVGAFVTFGAAAAFAATGTALAVFDHPTPTREDLGPTRPGPTARAAVMPLPGGAAAMITGRF